MENYENHHGENLKTVLQILGVPQRYFKDANIKTQQSISKYFKKKTLPDSTITELSVALGIEEKVIKKNILKPKIDKIIASIQKKK